MKSFRIGHLATVGLALCLVSAVRAEEPNAATMKDVVDALRASPVTAAETMYFEMLNQNAVIGIIVATLRPTEDEPSGLEYRVETLMKLPSGVRLKGLVTAQMTKAFEPRSIDMSRDLKAPDGKEQKIVDRVQVREKDIVVVHAEDGVASLPRSVPRPAEPFAFGLEFLVPRIDANNHPQFILHELNPQSGEIIEHAFRAEAKTDGTRTLRSRRPDGSDGYEYAFDATGKLLSWSEPPVTILTRRCSENRIAELRIQLAK